MKKTLTRGWDAMASLYDRIRKSSVWKRMRGLFSRNKPGKRDNPTTPYVLMLPWLIGLVIFVIIPVGMIFFMSFHDVLKTPQGFSFDFVSFENFLFAFTNPIFYQSLLSYVNMLFVYIPVILIMSFLIALLLNNDFKFRTTFRVIFFLPVVLLSNATLNNISTTSGENNAFLNIENTFIFSMIDAYVPFMADFLSGMFGVLIVILWFTGVPIVLYINGLKKIDQSIYEAAKIDGGNAWQILWLIIIPNIKSTALVIAIFSVVQVGIFNTNPLYGLLQEQIMMTATNLGIAATYALLYTIVTLLFIMLLIFILRDKDIVVMARKEYNRTRELYEKQKKHSEEAADEVY